MNFIEELRWRGMIHNEDALMPGTAEFFATEKTAGYIGYDPTGDSLHIGNLATIMMLVHLQRAGHKAFALVGGATGMVGDPSGKDKERSLLDMETLAYNQRCIRNQLAHFLDFEGENPAEMVNNYDWFQQMGFLEFLRDVGKHMTVNYMMSKESVKKRISGDQGISYTEFAYQLLQGYDFLHLFRERGVRLQMGGSDQWGNITTGTELIRRAMGHESKAYAITCPLVTREDGSKFGKTAEGKSVWLDGKKTPPYEFYQYWLNVGDQDAEKYIKVFTLKERAEIEELIATHREAPHLRQLQRALAEDITLRVHGAEGLASAEKLTSFLFGKANGPDALQGLSESDWDAVVQSASVKQLARTQLEAGINILDLLVALGITKSKGEARRAIEKDKSVQVNAEKVADIQLEIKLDHAFFGRYFQVQKGKKNKFVVELI